MTTLFDGVRSLCALLGAIFLAWSLFADGQVQVVLMLFAVLFTVQSRNECQCGAAAVEPRKRAR